jgi:hypothetical protein
MERARWLPGVLASRRVFINQPAYTATYYNGGKQDLSMRVVVGKRSNQTYFFDDKSNWSSSIPIGACRSRSSSTRWCRSCAPIPSYLDRSGYEVTAGGKRVSSSNVNWSRWGAAAISACASRRADANALGELKILFPNSHAIYMHDTPSKSLFQRDTRAYSHGCIRLQDPRAMAAKVLGTSVEAIGGTSPAGRTSRCSCRRRFLCMWPILPPGRMMPERSSILPTSMPATATCARPSTPQNPLAAPETGRPRFQRRQAAVTRMRTGRSGYTPGFNPACEVAAAMYCGKTI